MAKMKIEGEIYYLEAESERTLYNNYDEAIGEVKGLLNDEEPENIILLEMSIDKDEITATQVPWSKIAKEMVGGDS